MRKFTPEELSRCDGKNGSPIFIAHKGTVYDVSRSFLWKQGRHQVLHAAGVDLTAGLETAPHSADLLERFPIIGTLIDPE
ncbi:MAG: cytochrome B5 [Anaerolineales bacterium]|nr:cytochrome B5 [Anaerolineales bacterium]